MLTNCLAACTHLSSTVSQLFELQVQKSPFSHTAAQIFVSPGDAPAPITQYVAWMKRQFNACQTPHSIYLSIFDSFRVIRCLSQCWSPKIAIFTTFLLPLGTPWGNHAKCCMDGKRIRCLQIDSLHVPIMCPSNYYRFWDTARYLWKSNHFIILPLHSMPLLGGFQSEYRHPLWDRKTRMVSLPMVKKISMISLFVLTWSTNVTDRRTLDDSKDRACIASRGKNYC